MIASVRSVLPESTTWMSSETSAALARVAPMVLSALKVRMMTERLIGSCRRHGCRGGLESLASRTMAQQHSGEGDEYPGAAPGHGTADRGAESTARRPALGLGRCARAARP